MKLKNKIGIAAIMGKHPFAESDYLELAELLKISKSCLNHRLRKLMELSAKITEKK